MCIIFSIISIALIGAAAWKLGRMRGYEDRQAEEQKAYGEGKYGE